ncbi:metallophosphoesterase [Myxococcota bacterium]|nr:metallophosphoesterase [Myxococcota bacterium]
MRSSLARGLLALLLATLAAACGPGGGADDDDGDDDSGGGDGDPCAPELLGPGWTVEPSIAPFVTLTGPTSARLRFEVLEETPLPVRLQGEAGCAVEQWPVLSAAKLEYAFPDAGNSLGLEHWDAPGLHVVQDATFEDLVPGATYGWTVDLGGGASLAGTFRAPPRAGEAVRFAFMGDSMTPNWATVAGMIAGQAPDLVLHGGDLQYQTLPSDTWSGFFAAAAPVTSRAPFHVAIGNHEYEDLGEYEAQWVRLLGDQGEAGSGEEHHRFTYGGVRFLAVNTEAGLDAADHPQVLWLEAELAAADADPAVLFSVVLFHRPIWTLAEHGPREEERAVLHPLLAAHRVPLVLQAHNHSYERFLVDGVTYVVDGGGGALLYDVDGSVESHPDEVPLRLASSQTFGATIVDVAEDGAVLLRRLDVEGTVVDEVEVAVPAPGE